MKNFFLGILIFCCSLFSINCGKHPTQSARTQSAGLNIWAHVVKSNSSLAKTAATTWDSLVIKISSASGAAFMDTIVRAFKFDESDPFVSCTLDDVPAGKSRFVEAWTKNENGFVIHKAIGEKIDLASGEIKTLDLTLLPKRGSIYVDIANVPATANNDTITLVFASFSFGGQTLSDSLKRAKNAFLTIDNVPDSASGTLSIVGIGKSKDTLYCCALPLTFYASRDTSFSAKAVKVSTGFSINIIASQPAATIISASMDAKNTIDVEKGPCIITEIMYAANDSEYIEI